MVKTLQEIHKLNIIHRDIRPANLLFKSNNITVIDFGLATEMNGSKEFKDGFVGTSKYSPQAHVSNPTSQELIYSSATDLESFVKTMAFLKNDDVNELIIFENRLKSSTEKDFSEECTYLYNEWEGFFSKTRSL